jgi:L-Ala-D/L-Glu epimerase
MQIESFVENIVFRRPLAIAGRTLAGQSVLRVVARDGDRVAHAEAAGVFYRGESGARMLRDLESARDVLPRSPVDALACIQAMPAGGARNALDWALWQLVCAERGEPAYRLASLASVRPLVTMVTLGVAEPAAMAHAALEYPGAKALKLKLDGSDADAERVVAVRRERPDARLSIDANEGWTLKHLDRMLGVLTTHGVELIEQPLAAIDDSGLEDLRSPIPLAADESLQTLDDLDRVARRYQVANIKLDKCGGLTAALTLATEARRRGMRVMVGCMGGRSMAILPAFIAAQTADLVDLDGPLLMATDTVPSARYVDGCVDFPESAFGALPAGAVLSASL